MTGGLNGTHRPATRNGSTYRVGEEEITDAAKKPETVHERDGWRRIRSQPNLSMSKDMIVSNGSGSGSAKPDCGVIHNGDAGVRRDEDVEDTPDHG
eukprot:CAMPEP_0175952616 /NCGR_PEP_ID=MMETSP0108-20121206/30861_1 /TAXON_ID=195067 ORGANISM="Goniomonas pacifica, Strain CCMP1869" /NCGR_SAMPLE_ID=MMETSP0108 /ASSEMBLY_ACC=CAM_ASM_000204 /LENGTH=95 /DNA_ID=CAMNT_0017279019 /DNA_START=29 /DNA_END=314 /DNA_ORIENTATION=+